MATDSITDMLTRIRNAQAVSHPEVDIPFSQLNYKIAKVLESEGFIEKVSRKGRKPKKIIRIVLKYKDKKGVISGLKRISKPGQRIYLKVKDIRPIRTGFGMAIISTPKGLMTDKTARKKRLGGEIICEIW